MSLVLLGLVVLSLRKLSIFSWAKRLWTWACCDWLRPIKTSRFLYSTFPKKWNFKIYLLSSTFISMFYIYSIMCNFDFWVHKNRNLYFFRMSEPLKLLCLHGFRQSAAGFRTKTGGMRKNLKKKCEYVFIGMVLM